MNSKEPQQVNVSHTTRQSQIFRGLRRKRLIVAILILVIAAVAGGWYVNDRSSQKKLYPPKPRSYSFDNNKGDVFVANHRLQGGRTGMGMEFSRPFADFLYVDAPFDKTDPRVPKNPTETFVDPGFNVELGQRLAGLDKTLYHQALIAARIVAPENQAQFSIHGYFRQVLNRYVFTGVKDPTKLFISLSAPANFTNSNIKENTSIYQLNAQDLSEPKTGLVGEVKGELIEVKGKQANYYLLIVAIPANWEANPKTWQAIKGSIKVDQ